MKDFHQELGKRLSEIIKLPGLDPSKPSAIAHAALDRPTPLGNSEFRSAFISILDQDFICRLMQARDTNQLISAIKSVDDDNFMKYEEKIRSDLRQSFRCLIQETKKVGYFASQEYNSSMVVKPKTGIERKKQPQASFTTAAKYDSNTRNKNPVSSNATNNLASSKDIVPEKKPGRILLVSAATTSVLCFITGLINQNLGAFVFLISCIAGPAYVYKALKPHHGRTSRFLWTLLGLLSISFFSMMSYGIALGLSGNT